MNMLGIFGGGSQQFHSSHSDCKPESACQPPCPRGRRSGTQAQRLADVAVSDGVRHGSGQEGGGQGQVRRRSGQPVVHVPQREACGVAGEWWQGEQMVGPTNEPEGMSYAQPDQTRRRKKSYSEMQWLTRQCTHTCRHVCMRAHNTHT